MKVVFLIAIILASEICIFSSDSEEEKKVVTQCFPCSKSTQQLKNRNVSGPDWSKVVADMEQKHAQEYQKQNDAMQAMAKTAAESVRVALTQKFRREKRALIKQFQIQQRELLLATVSLFTGDSNPVLCKFSDPENQKTFNDVEGMIANLKFRIAILNGYSENLSYTNNILRTKIEMLEKRLPSDSKTLLPVTGVLALHPHNQNKNHSFTYSFSQIHNSNAEISSDSESESEASID
jgi:hypothetical protein